jgi:hypothetical protein
MNPISDNELILYFYRDGLDAKRIAEIDDELFTSVDLRTRYTQLQEMLHRIDVRSAIKPDEGFYERVWRRLEARLDREHALASPSRRSHWHDWLRVLSPPRLALVATCLLAVAIGGGYYLGRTNAPQPDEVAQARANAMAARVLDAYVVEHLRTTENLLLTTVNSDSAELRAGDRDVAATLVESNRMYALAASRSGNTRLAEFLRQLEPVLLEVANQPAGGSIQSVDGLRDYLRKTDLLFQVRATQARIDNAGKPRT